MTRLYLVINVFSKDVSAGGLCIIAEEELAPDTPLELEVKVPDLKDSIRALGRVVWQTKFEAANEQTKVFFNTGVEFTGISDFDRFNHGQAVSQICFDFCVRFTISKNIIDSSQGVRIGFWPK